MYNNQSDQEQYINAENNQSHVSQNTQSQSQESTQYNDQESIEPSYDGKNQQEKKNERFIISALVAGVVIISTFVGLGVALFYPKQNNSVVSAVNPQIEENIVNESTNSDGEVIIIYGTEDEVIDENINNSANAEENNNVDSQVVTNNTATNTTSSGGAISQPQSTQSVTPQTNSTRVISSSPTQNTSTKKIVQTSVQQNTNPTTQKKETTYQKTVVAKETPSNPNISPVTKKPIVVMSDASKQKLYWVQVFSTNNKNKAMLMKEELKKNGITVTVVTKNINDKLFYRLRIGPYYNKSESSKFLQWVQKIESYKDAYITVNYI